MEGQERPFAAAGHARFHAAVPLRESGAAAGAAMAGVGRRPLEPGLEGHGAFREAGGDAGTGAARHRANRPCLRARLCRFPFRRLRLAQGLSKTRCVPPEDAGAAVGEDFGAAAGIKPVKSAAGATDFPARQCSFHHLSPLAGRGDVQRRESDQSNRLGVWFTAAPSIASIFSFVTTPPLAEKPPGLPPAASTRWHGTTIGQGLRPSAWPTSRDSSTPPSFLAISP